VALTLAAFGTIYALIHKIFVPLMLSLLGTSRADYARVDVWALAYIAFALWLHYRQHLGTVGSLFVGLLVSHSLGDTVLLSIDPAPFGWLAFSKMISAWPAALTGLWMMSMGVRRPIFPAFVGALLAGGLLTWAFESSPIGAPPVKPSMAHVTANPQTKTPETRMCGAQELTVARPRTRTTSTTLVIRDCGFTPSVLRLTGTRGRIRVDNQTLRAQTLRFVVFSDHGKRVHWNTVMPHGTQREFLVQVEGDEIGALLSDAAPRLGLTAVVGGQSGVHWELTRTPLSVRRAP